MQELANYQTYVENRTCNLDVKEIEFMDADITASCFYTSRSEYVRAAIRAYLLSEEWMQLVPKCDKEDTKVSISIVIPPKEYCFVKNYLVNRYVTGFGQFVRAAIYYFHADMQKYLKMFPGWEEKMLEVPYKTLSKPKVVGRSKHKIRLQYYYQDVIDENGTMWRKKCYREISQ